MHLNSVALSPNHAGSPLGSPRRLPPCLAASALLALTVLLLAIPAAGCNAPAAPSASTPSPATAEPSPSSIASPTVALASVAMTVTLADDGKAISLKPGDRFLLSLDAFYDWTVAVDDPAIVTRLTGVAGPTGSQGVFQALAAGQTTLSAVGDPPCRQVKPACGAPSRLFRVAVVVR